MNKKRIIATLLSVGLVSMLYGVSVFAADPTTSCDPTDARNFLTCFAGKSGYGSGTPGTPGMIIARVLAVFFGLLGVIFLLLTVYAGFNWMTAMGDPKKIQSAKDTIKASTIGLALIIAAEMISFWVISQLASNIGRQ